jgi:putative transcriptional regulator
LRPSCQKSFPHQAGRSPFFTTFTSHMQPGTLLVSSPLLGGDYFEQSVVLITEYHPANGALGYVVNKLHDRPLHHLQQFRHAPALPLYQGGPVQADMLYLLHRSPQQITGGTLVVPGLYSGGNMQQVVHLLSAGHILPRHLKCLLGYCGWHAGELEAEIAEGSWRVSNQPWQMVFELHLHQLTEAGLWQHFWQACQ